MDHTEKLAAIKLAYAAHLATGTKLLLAWQATVSPDLAAQMDEYLALKMPIGILLTGPEDFRSCIAHVVVTQRGAVVKILDSIELDLVE